jgi:hypothetical protein
MAHVRSRPVLYFSIYLACTLGTDAIFFFFFAPAGPGLERRGGEFFLIGFLGVTYIYVQ